MHREIGIHTRRRSQRLRFFDFATFDYRRLCTDLFARTGADFLRARITGAGKGVVHTTAGSFEAPIVIEAAGLAHVGPQGARRQARRAAQELRASRRASRTGATGCTSTSGPSNGSRRFYWIFPAGDHVRAGLATYTGDSALSEDLDEFLDRHGSARPGTRTAGSSPRGMIDPMRDGMFVVGDAAGHCLPVSGEGIRPALVFGQLAGRLAERVRLGELTLDQALSATGPTCCRANAATGFLDRLQTVLNWLPDPLFALFARTIATRGCSRWAVRRYWDVADPDLLTPAPSPQPIPEVAATP